MTSAKEILSPAKQPSLSRVFEKVGDIVHCQLNMKLPNRHPSSVVWDAASDRNNVWSDDFKDPFSPELSFDEDPIDTAASKAVVQGLENALREAKQKYLQCGEVLLPHDLTWHISQDILHQSANEPCGLRGCTIYINLEEKAGVRRIGKVKYDPNTVTTFDIFLTLRQDTNSWVSLKHFIPSRILRSLGKRTTLVLSSNYTVEKKKLYRSSSTSS